jgi:hypothetical protein
MRSLASLLVLSAFLLGGCGPKVGIAEVAAYPLDKKETLKEAQKRYTANIRYGLFEDATPFVEPELQPRFQEAIPRFRELRLSDFRIESIDIDPARTRATAVVQYRGYWLSSPYEREIRVVQHWRRQVPTQNWYVTPDFDTLLGPAGG